MTANAIDDGLGGLEQITVSLSPVDLVPPMGVYERPTTEAGTPAMVALQSVAWQAIQQAWDAESPKIIRGEE